MLGGEGPQDQLTVSAQGAGEASAGEASAAGLPPVTTPDYTPLALS